MNRGIRHNEGKPQVADRYNSGKERWALVDFEALKPMVHVLAFGAQKYSDDNWKKGLKTKEICESLIRHLTAYLSGQDNDAESGLPEVGHILCNAMFLSYMMQFRPDMDNREKTENPKGGILDESNFRHIPEYFAVRLRRDVNVGNERLIIEQASSKLSSRIKKDLAIDGNRIQTIIYGRRVDLLFLEGEWWEVINTLNTVSQ